MVIHYSILALLWIVWCTLHSAMISLTVTKYLQERLGERFKYYRLIYNFVAGLSIMIPITFGYSLRGEPIFTWQGIMLILQAAIFLSSMFFFYAGARKYDLAQFVGIAQIRSGKFSALLSDGGKLDTTGIHGITRHPWYFGGILLIWSYRSEIDLQCLITNIVLSCYFVVGAYLEEKKLLLWFGEEFKEYRKHVSMLFPMKWLLKR